MADTYVRTEQDKAAAAANMQLLIDKHGLFIHPKAYQRERYGDERCPNVAAFMHLPHTSKGIHPELLNVINDFLKAYEMYSPTATSDAIARFCRHSITIN